MKSTGVTRHIDGLGRFVIPKELRDSLDIEEGDLLEIYTEDESIILRKHQPACIFCDEEKDTFLFKGKRICHACCEILKRQL